MAKKLKETLAGTVGTPNDTAATGFLELQVRGDNRAARDLASETLSQADCPAQAREAAEDTLSRTGLDAPTVAVALAACAAILALAGLLIMA